MLGGGVASTEEPDYPSREADGGAYPERRSPAVTNHDPGYEQRRKAGARAHTGKDPSVRKAALRCWNPASDELIGRGIDDRLSGAQKKSDYDEHEERARFRGNQGSQGSEDSPPYHAPGQNPARSVTVSEPA